MEKTAEDLRMEFGYWGNHPHYTAQEWQAETRDGNTRLGYWEWVATLLNGDSEADVAAIPTFTVADVDRLLGLCDQFLDEWSEDAVQSGSRDLEYEARRAEWTAMRPLLASAPRLLNSLQAIIEIACTSAEPGSSYCAAIARKAIAELGAQQGIATSATSSATDLAAKRGDTGGA